MRQLLRSAKPLPANVTAVNQSQPSKTKKRRHFFQHKASGDVSLVSTVHCTEMKPSPFLCAPEETSVSAAALSIKGVTFLSRSGSQGVRGTPQSSMKDYPRDRMCLFWEVFAGTQLEKRGCVRSAEFHRRAGRTHLLEAGEVISGIHLNKSKSAVELITQGFLYQTDV